MSLSSAGRLLKGLADNWPVKVLAVALAIALVAVYRVSTLSTRTLTVPLSVETSHSLIPASAFPASVRVTLRGEDDGVRSIADGDVVAFVDLSRHEEEGWYRAPVQVRRTGAALEVEPLEISVSPLEVALRLDRRINLVLPLVAPVQGSVASGFDLVSHSIVPPEVSVSGPVSVLGYLTEIATSPVVLEGRSGDFTVAVSVINPSPLLSVRGNGAVEFRGVVRPAVPVRTIEGIPITLAGLPEGLSADLGGRTGLVRIEGSWDRIDAFAPGPGFLSADASGVGGPGSHVLPVSVSGLPAGFTLIWLEPESVSLSVMAGGDWAGDRYYHGYAGGGAP